MKKIYEKIYPGIGGLIVLTICWKFNLNFFNSKNISEALNADITVASIIIGFLGAVLPVVLAMKNDSFFVRYVFEMDKDKLFLEYIKKTIVSAIISIVISMLLYFRDLFFNYYLLKSLFFLWIGSFVYMLLCTYRSVSNMIKLMFSEDRFIPDCFKSMNQEKTRKLEKKKKEFAEEIDKI